ncbi:MAG: nucleoside-diphosphate kinase [Candidatus Marinimicrobia bacterium]|jgi:nucleoside-diphosphate kinase|nr:nucleoside-diphosphate kinase [Candidatus Neomarinimicrobiota bacterium]MBT3618609.1 nucleoside-diphosphate kinase [Candidatus Neomarinimicrobiota bacterium]MBT3829641.1 nucleoside-diphosphate kinase [Candidatus Neomarinimicrobiota bacterium]MBT3997358.1 nucleoside-diphosphate kinase [Candidatus Neomarinimicrobiota bacterium]MBT4281047.1 nucleoside-diphosphate kinase [Candidatus Neomarinimicrobiota bacterium]
MSNKTLAIIKPDAVKNAYTGKIIDRILSADFKVLGARLVHLSREKAEEFYTVHKDRPFYNDLVDFMTSGPCMPLALNHEDAVNSFRKLIGSTNPAEAEEGTIRKDFAESVQNNAVHGSDSNENAEKEIAFFFTSNEIHYT